MTRFGVGVAVALVSLWACGGSGSNTSLLEPATGSRYGGARFSPDGERISVIIAYDDDSPEKVGVIDRATGSLTELAVAGSYLAGAVWEHDGSHLIFTGEEKIFRVAAAGGEPEVLLDSTFDTNAAMAPDLDPDDSHLVYAVNGGSIVIADLATKTFEDTEIPGDSPRYSPDGNSLAYLANDSLVVDNGTKQSIAAPNFVGGTLAWFADGQSVAYTADSPDEDDVDTFINVYTLATKDVSKIHAAFSIGTIDISNDGKHLVFDNLSESGLTLLEL